MKEKRNLIIVILIGICISLGFILHFNLKKKPIETGFDIIPILSKVDSLQKENDSLKVVNTILIQREHQLIHSIDSLGSIRPKNIKHINDEIKRLHNADTPAKLIIGDSILRARKKARSTR